MSAADRQRAIVAAAVPLLLRRGASVTTAEIARAARIAEGTIFRAFPDKSALILAAVREAMDAAGVSRAIRAIDPSSAMDVRLTQAAGLLRDYFDQVIAIGQSLRPAASQGASRQDEVGRLIRESSTAITAALKALFESHRAALRVPPSAAIAAFRGLVFASAHPLLPPRERLPIEEAVSILMSGITSEKTR